ncbi:hypothetical protein [Brachybacterium massiliense]|uniref:hypothetical protein n=1 Tax=Brachybacterium massiliense TaxID=1755098 RepID=UPI000B3BC2D7|nr:hypothetical protein [Brachybacterium massiliense]
MATFRTRNGQPVKYAYEYQITRSDHPKVPVGRLLYDHGRELLKTWNFFEEETGKVLSLVGPRSRRICSTCAADYRVFAPHGHPGEHSEDVQRLTFPHPDATPTTKES